MINLLSPKRGLQGIIIMTYLKDTYRFEKNCFKENELIILINYGELYNKDILAYFSVLMYYSYLNNHILNEYTYVIHFCIIYVIF